MCNPVTKVKAMRNTCEHYIGEALKIRLEELEELLLCAANEHSGRLENYALCFEYVAPGTFKDQDKGYWRYCMSWGGPSDEFRFYMNEDHSRVRVEYWFMDWFDGAHRDCTKEAVALHLWFWLVSNGAVSAATRH